MSFEIRYSDVQTGVSFLEDVDAVVVFEDLGVLHALTADWYFAQDDDETGLALVGTVYHNHTIAFGESWGRPSETELLKGGMVIGKERGELVGSGLHRCEIFAQHISGQGDFDTFVVFLVPH
jgi:hypothetical protein